MSKLRTKLMLKTIGQSGISMDLEIQKGATLLNVILTILKFMPIDLELAKTKINQTIDKEINRRELNQAVHDADGTGEAGL